MNNAADEIKRISTKNEDDGLSESTATGEGAAIASKVVIIEMYHSFIVLAAAGLV